MPMIRPTIDAREIFLHASSFHKSVEALKDSFIPNDGSMPDDQNVGLIAQPALVLSKELGGSL
jgi:hypothetical protein